MQSKKRVLFLETWKVRDAAALSVVQVAPTVSVFMFSDLYWKLELKNNLRSQGPFNT